MKKKVKDKKMNVKSGIDGGCGGCGYFLGVIGAAVYYVSTATSFWMGVLGVLKGGLQ